MEGRTGDLGFVDANYHVQDGKQQGPTITGKLQSQSCDKP